MQGRQERDETWIEQKHRFTQTSVAEADALMPIEPTIVHPDESLGVIVRQALAQPACLVVSVVDDAGRLVGLLPTRQLAFGVFVRVLPEAFLRYVTDLRHSSEVAAMIHGRTAREVMRPPQFVRPGDTLEEAFGRLLTTDLEGLPVVDDAMRVIGYLGLFEMLNCWLHAFPAGMTPQGPGDTHA